MNKSRAFSKRFLYFLVISLGLYLQLVNMQWLKIESESALKIVGILLAIFLLGLLIVAPGLNKSAENFTLRFLILTTVQMLSVLSIILALIYLKQPEAKTIGFHLIFSFTFLLAIQSVLLIRINEKK